MGVFLNCFPLYLVKVSQGIQSSPICLVPLPACSMDPYPQSPRLWMTSEWQSPQLLYAGIEDPNSTFLVLCPFIHLPITINENV